MKTSFIRAWWGSCSGTDIFIQLRSQSLWRSLVHLVLMSLLSALVIGIGVYPGLLRKVDFSINEISKNCGTLIISKNGIVPEKAPDLPRKYCAVLQLSTIQSSAQSRTDHVLAKPTFPHVYH